MQNQQGVVNTCEFFDSHVHLDFAAFDELRVCVLNRAITANVTRLFVPGVNPANWHKLDELQQAGWQCESNMNRLSIRVGVGLHPYWTSDEQTEGYNDLNLLVADMENHVQRLSAAAIGEMGLDKNKGASIGRQKAIFEAQLSLARDLRLPVVLHQVGLRDEFLACIKRVGLSAGGGVVHGFSGDEAWGQTLIRLGLHLGVGASIVHPARNRLRQALTQLPLARMLIETDAPDGRFRAPSQDAGSALASSEPMDVAQVAAQLSSLLNTELTTVALVTFQNATELFRF